MKVLLRLAYCRMNAPTTHVTPQNHFIKTRFRILKGYKDKKIQELPPFGKFFTKVLIFAAAKTFFELNQVFIADIRPGFCSGFL